MSGKKVGGYYKTSISKFYVAIYPDKKYIITCVKKKVKGIINAKKSTDRKIREAYENYKVESFKTRHEAEKWVEMEIKK